MPRVDNDVLRLLLKKSALSPEEWEEIVEARRERLCRHFDGVTLETIQDVRCMQYKNRYEKISLVAAQTDPSLISVESSDEYNLKTKGIFYYESSRLQDTPSVLRFWGVSRKKKWVLVTVFSAVNSDRVQVPHTVVVEEATLEELNALSSLFDIWKKLGDELKGFTKKRLEQYEKLKSDEEIVQFEHEIYAEK